MTSLAPFFVLAAVSPGRQGFFRYLVAIHLVLLAIGAALLQAHEGSAGRIILGNFALIAGIVEGALIIGWRLSQLPKSQALEFLLVSPLHPSRVFSAEALVGVTRLAFVTLAGLPLFLLLHFDGQLTPFDVATLLLIPFLWGVLSGLALATWAYESAAVRWIGEKVMIAGLLLYLVVGIIAGENLRSWLAVAPGDIRYWFLTSFAAAHQYNPFASMRAAMEFTPAMVWSNWLTVQTGGAIIVSILFVRAAFRLQGHFRDRHYRPVLGCDNKRRGMIGEQPLSWWAVKRVTEYAGRINLWLAGGFGVLYAIYTVAGPHWPAWMGRGVFQVFDRLGGIPTLTTALVLLAAVPAAFQYGLWDSNTQDRCRRLELLLLTDLRAVDYWRAAAAAAWHRGRGYFAIALLLWLAGLAAGQFTFAQAASGLAAGVILWGLYFALGFRAFSRGLQANTMGILLTLGLPGLAWLLFKVVAPWLVSLVPPGAVFWLSTSTPTLAWVIGPTLCTAATLVLARLALHQCEEHLRRWYECYHGHKVID